MSGKPVVPRDRAWQDVEAAAECYSAESGLAVAVAFVDAVESTFGAIAEHPAIGSPRYAYELGVPDLRTHALKRLPLTHLLRRRAYHIDVWRVLHAQRDIPILMREAIR